MSPDRYGEPDPETRCRDPKCHRGWLGHDTEGRPIPCLTCKPHLNRTAATNDCADRPPSPRAQRAIDRDT
ncbi:hypothetical protein NONO_c59970 [Nocardia nova SH22a]|uniref:Uncharacterized protein n=1 Tax=Nocardia nova SH22a TaxID=1415166 RepID=W5TP97_9NOCA|nr:hypothetical protein [Nocardia nova]AHH20773.1 hypothetical protein NONO_c59970 [Nocardia nova SH22a]